jgi:hypothetical protein
MIDPRVEEPTPGHLLEAVAWRHSGISDMDPGYGEPVGIRDFFENLVQRLIQDNLEFVATASDSNRSIQVLHLIPAVQRTGYRADYHQVYESFDSYRQEYSYGAVIANPPIRAPFRDYYSPEGTARHYRTESNQGVRRQDLAPGRTIFTPLIEGYIEHASKIRDPAEDSILRELKVDALLLKSAMPIRARILPKPTTAGNSISSY